MLTGFYEYYHGISVLNTLKKGGIRLLVLIPHREARNRIRAWSEGLFAAGTAGLFPWAAPLACLSRPLNPGELRDAAFTLREANRRGDGKIRTAAPAFLPDLLPPPVVGGAGGKSTGPRGPALYGPRLDLCLGQALQGGAASKILRLFSPIVLGAALIENPEENPAAAEALPPPPETAFRAAALANMICRFRRTQGAALFEWKIGKPRWLPSAGAKTEGPP
jgi:hypothetical protein